MAACAITTTHISPSTCNTSSSSTTSCSYSSSQYVKRNVLISSSRKPLNSQLWGSSSLKMPTRKICLKIKAQQEQGPANNASENVKKNVKKTEKKSEGVFAPLVVLTRNIVGKKQFNQLRGKAIALHSQVITEFCKSIGADAKQRQGLIRLAKKNGEKLGFLA